MWISREISEGKKNSDRSDIGEINEATENNVSIQGKQEYRKIPLILPYGLVSVPEEGSKAVVVPAGEGLACAGVIPENVTLSPGEIMICSAGGASIVLNNSGQVLINGVEY